jgi:hypothetical protein
MAAWADSIGESGWHEQHARESAEHGPEGRPVMMHEYCESSSTRELHRAQRRSWSTPSDR